MRRALPWSSLLLAVLPAGAGASEDAQSVTVLGSFNQPLADGSRALESGRYQEGIRLTIEGLERPNNPRDEAAGHSNLCAGYAALKRWSDALPHCNRSLELDRGNWRTFNNRAAVYVGLELYDFATADIHAGLELAPNSDTLHKSLKVVDQHREAARRDRRRRPNKA